MRPQTLTLKAFGPYMNETIDFSTFYGNNIFLIAGKTGSGKTTLFDGICFALFGKTNGSNREPKEMRSTFATSKEETSVTFTFETQNKRYEITRSPAQTLLKLKGEGTREVPAKATITIYNDSGEELEQFSKISEVDAVIEEVVQLNSDQFRQIVMIPQGEFRRFLNADSGDKEIILRKLFGTDIYRQFSEKLKEQKKAAASQLAKKEAALAAVLSRAHWNQEKPETETDGFSGLKEEFELLKNDRKDMTRQLEKIKEALERLINETTEADQYFKEQQTIQGYLDEKKELTKSLNQLEQLRPHVQDLRMAILAYEQAIAFEPLMRKIEETEHALGQAQKNDAAVKKQEAEARAALSEYQKMKERVESERAEQNQRTEQLIKLEQLQKSIEQYQESKTQSEQQEKVVQTLEQEKAILVTEQQEVQQEKQSLKQQLDALTKKQDQYYRDKDALQLWKQGQAVLTELLQMKEQKKQQEIELQDKRTALAVNQQNLQLAKNEYNQIKSDWAKIQIQKLAADLVAGEPCPVCGSIEHPMHIEQNESTQSGIELEQILEDQEKQVTAYQTKNEVLLHTISQLEKQGELFEENITQQTAEWTLFAEQLSLKSPAFSEQLEELTHLVTSLRQQIDQLTNELSRRPEWEEKYATVKVYLEQNQMKLNSKTTALQSAVSQFDQLRGRFEQLQQGIPEKYLDTECYKTEVQTLNEAIGLWTKEYEKATGAVRDAEKTVEQHQYTLKTIKDSIIAAKEKHHTLLEQLATEIESSDFTSTEEVEKMLHDKESIANWREEINQFEKELYNIQQNLKKNKEKLADQPEPKVAEAKAIYERLSEQRTQKNGELVLLEEHCRQNTQVLKEAEAILSQQKQAVERYTEIVELSDVANGDTGSSKLGLERYVLSYYLEEVLHVANQRLQKLSNNRYWFDLNRESGSYKNRTGLEINIYDDHAGGVRNVGTLSGGESFVAALSLALSLSDVVQRQSGGIQIEAIFIDEGFGSLDEDALDKAVEALMQIDGDGKLVGIISHVKELKERIPDKILVHALGTGKSNLQVSHA